MTLFESWASHPTRRAELAALMREPALADAISIVREIVFIPKTAPKEEQDKISWYALNGARREGYLEMLANLLALANITPFKLPDKKPWETTEDEKRAALEKMQRELGVSASPESPPAAPSEPQPPNS